MTSASDIITYIGIPLAVLGVLPILYTFVLGILTQRRIRATLIHHGHKPLSSTRPHDGFTIRSSPMTSLIEVELPRYTIAPLERSCDDYWRTSDLGSERDEEHHGLLERAESTLSMIEEGRVKGFLRGGSWRAFQWKKLIVGRKLYRIQYEDELREPPAEIDFSDLIHFLLDWGAVPDVMGWEKLKSGGLWTPSGTVLLRKAQDDNELKTRAIDWVLRTSVPDESDGVLTLSIRWTKDMEDIASTRGAASLPPGWGRLLQPPFLDDEDKVTKDRKDLPARIEELRNNHKHSQNSTSIRFCSDEGLVSQIHWEISNIDTGSTTFPFQSYSNPNLAATWFTCAASSLLSHSPSTTSNPSPSILWNFTPPTDLTLFVRKDTIPCEILVLFGILPEHTAPQWTSSISPSGSRINQAQIYADRLTAERAAISLEATMPADQARVHRMNREAETRRQRHQDMMTQISERQEREERRIKDAIASPRMHNRAVAEAGLAWLIEAGEVGKNYTVEDLARAVLYLLILDIPISSYSRHSRTYSQSHSHIRTHSRNDSSTSNPNPSQANIPDESPRQSEKIIQILEEWHNFSLAGGMKKQTYHMLEGAKVEFCFAAALVAVVQAAVLARGNGGSGAGSGDDDGAAMGRGSADMWECLRLWRKVRLG